MTGISVRTSATTLGNTSHRGYRTHGPARMSRLPGVAGTFSRPIAMPYPVGMWPGKAGQAAFP